MFMRSAASPYIAAHELVNTNRLILFVLLTELTTFFVPSTAGTIIPNNKMGGVTNNIVVNVDVDGGASVDADENNSKQFGLALAAAIQSEIINQKRAGGLLA